jgi:hypothetical protein
MPIDEASNKHNDTPISDTKLTGSTWPRVEKETLFVKL